MRHSSQDRLWIALALCGLSLLPARAGAQAFGEVTDVVAVEVPVQVVRDGQPVRGLTAHDFEVFEGRKRQKVVGFEVVDLAAPVSSQAARTPPAPVPAAARRHFLLLFDLSFSEPRALAQARQAARGLVRERLAASDLVAVATYSAKGSQIVLGFSPDRRQVDRAIDLVGLPEMIDRNPDPLKLMAAELRRELVGTDVKAADNQNMLEGLEAALRESERATATQKKAQVTALSRSFAELARLMDSVVGRKYVVYLSEGFDSSVLTGTADQEEIDRINQSLTDGEFYNVDTTARYGNTEAGNDLARMLEEFRRADCVIQSVDIGGLRGDGDMNPQRRTGQDGLFLMAHDTGGELYRNFNDLGAAMDQMLQRTSVTYVLTLQPEGLRRDASFHRLRVELRNGPKGARVVHRPGYYAPKPFAKQSGVEKALQAASRILEGGDAGAIATAVLAAPFRRSEPGEQRAYVPVLIEVDGKGLLAGHEAPVIPAEIFIYALDGQGSVHDFQTQTVGLEVSKTGEALRRTGLKFFGHVDLEPGEYSLRVLVRNGATGAFGLRVVPLTVPAPAQVGQIGQVGQAAPVGPVLLPPFFPEPAGRWVLVPEAQREGETRPDYPFLLGGEPFVPAASPVLGAGEEARLELVGWNLGEGDLRAAARVTTADGREMPAGTLSLGKREPGTGAAPDRLVATFRTADLQPGEYRLAVQLTGPAGAVTSAPLPFTVPAPARR
jgi:VWFA-related protein